MHDALERIRDRTIPEMELWSAIRTLGHAGEAAAFWLGIANDPAYGANHRAIAICQFFKRHVPVPISIAELAALLGNPDWIAFATVAEVRHLKGELPVEWNPGEGVLAIRAFPAPPDGAPVLYLRLAHRVEPALFVQLVRGATDTPGGDTSILQAACTEPPHPVPLAH